MSTGHDRTVAFDRTWLGPAALRPRVFRSQHEKDTWMSVCVEDEYHTPSFEAHDAVIDIGAHMGSWSMRAWLNGSRNIHAFEIDPEMREIYPVNLAGCDGVTLYEGVTRERFDNLVESLGFVRFVKMDCEGCEWPILFGSRQLHRVHQMSGEYHECVAGSVPPDELLARLERLGFMAKVITGAPGLGYFRAVRP